MASRRSVTNLHVRGACQFDREFSVRGVPLKVARLLRATLAGVTSGEPTFVVLVNTLGFTPTVGRNSAGQYDFGANDGFILGKTFCRANSLNDGGAAVSYNFQALFDDDAQATALRLQPLDSDGNPTDSFEASIEVDVYD